MLEKVGAKNGGTGIVMDVNSGAIIAMASYPNFDPGDYSTVHDEKLLATVNEELAALEAKRDTYESEKAYSEAVNAVWQKAQGLQWRNRCVSDTYEPGSTFKPITLAVALEEGIVNMNSTFSCSGSIMVQGWDKAFNCSKRRSGFCSIAAKLLQPGVYHHWVENRHQDVLQISPVLWPYGAHRL